MAFHNLIVFQRDAHLSVVFYIITCVFPNCRAPFCALLEKDHNYMDILNEHNFFSKPCEPSSLSSVWCGSLWIAHAPLTFRFWNNTAKIHLLLTHCLILSQMAEKRMILYSFWTFSNSVSFNLISKCVDGFKILQSHVHLIPEQTSLKNSSACTSRI